MQNILTKKIKTDFFQKSAFFESSITQKRSIFEQSFISYAKRQKSCTLIVIYLKCLYLTSPTLNSSTKSNRLFLLQRRKQVIVGRMVLNPVQIGSKKLHSWLKNFEGKIRETFFMKNAQNCNTIPEKKCVYITDKIKCTHGIVFLQTHYIEVVFLSNYAILTFKSRSFVSPFLF